MRHVFQARDLSAQAFALGEYIVGDDTRLPMHGLLKSESHIGFGLFHHQERPQFFEHELCLTTCRGPLKAGASGESLRRTGHDLDASAEQGLEDFEGPRIDLRCGGLQPIAPMLFAGSNDADTSFSVEKTGRVLQPLRPRSRARQTMMRACPGDRTNGAIVCAARIPSHVMRLAEPSPLDGSTAACDATHAARPDPLGRCPSAIHALVMQVAHAIPVMRAVAISKFASLVDACWHNVILTDGEMNG